MRIARGRSGVYVAPNGFTVSPSDFLNAEIAETQSLAEKKQTTTSAALGVSAVSALKANPVQPTMLFSVIHCRNAHHDLHVAISDGLVAARPEGAIYRSPGQRPGSGSPAKN